jgi:protein O-GlcNAc transferase
LIFAPRLPVANHLARYRLADLFLDTLPVNAHTTASDALWVGLPVLTCLGNAFVGRVAASLLNAVGLPELITTSLAQYEQLALELAHAPERLLAMRQKLLTDQLDFPLFDLARKREHLETAYLEMHSRTSKGLPHGPFEIVP